MLSLRCYYYIVISKLCHNTHTPYWFANEYEATGQCCAPKSAREKKSGMCCKAGGVNEPPSAFVADELRLFLRAHEIVYCVHKVRLCNKATKQNIG